MTRRELCDGGDGSGDGGHHEPDPEGTTSEFGELTEHPLG